MNYRTFINRSKGLLLAFAAGSAVAGSSVAAQDSGGDIQIRVASNGLADSLESEGASFLIRRARLPIFVDVDLGSEGGLPEVPRGSVARIITELDRNPRRLITIRLDNVALRFADLSAGTQAILLERRGEAIVSAYEKLVAGMVLDLIEGVRAERPRAPLTIQGVPFEGSRKSAAASNEIYGPVIDRMSAFFLGGGILVSGGGNEGPVLRRAYPNTLRLAAGRALLFASDGGWRIATESAEPIQGSALAGSSGAGESAGSTVAGDGVAYAGGGLLASPATDPVDGTGMESVTGGPDGDGAAPNGSAGFPSGGGGSGGGATGGTGPGGGGGGSSGGAAAGGSGGDIDSADGEAESQASEGVSDDEPESGVSDPGDEVDPGDDQASGSEENEDPGSEGSEAGGQDDDAVGETEDGGDGAEGDGEGEGASGEGADSDGESGTEDEGAGDVDDEGDGAGDEPAEEDEGDDVWDAEDEIDEGDEEGSGDAGGDGDGSSEGGGGGDEPVGGDGDGPGDADGGDSSDDDEETWADTLVPGDGFVGETSQPGTVPGSGAFSDKECIVRWNVVHLREYRDSIRVGVVAFHANGVDRVLFECDGGEIAVADSMEVNPRTGNREFSVVLEPASDDRVVEIRATVIPKDAGVPVVLQGDWTEDSAATGRHSLFLVSNSRDTLESLEYFVDPALGDDSVGTAGSNGDPFATIARAILEIGVSDQPRSCHIRLKRPGEYRLWNYTSGFGQRPDGVLAPNGVLNSEWITISPIDGIDRDEVILVSSGGGGVAGEPGRGEVNHNTSFLCYRNLSIDLGTVITVKGARGRWYDNCEMYDGSGILEHPDPGGGQSWWVRGDSVFATDCDVYDTLLGYCGMTLVRNSTCTRVYADQFTHAKMVVGSSSDEAAGTVLTYHADCHQWWGPVENIIVFDVDHLEPAFMQGFYLDDLVGTTFKNVAIIDVGFDNPRNGTSSEQTQIHGPAENMIFAHVSLPWQFVTLKTEQAWNPFQPDDVLFYGCVFRRLFNHGFNTPGIPEGAYVENCHFQDAGATGPHPGTTSGAVVMELSDDGIPTYTGVGAAGVMTGIPVFSEASSSATVWRGNLPPE